MDRKDKKSKNKRRNKKKNDFVTKQQLDKILDNIVEDKFIDTVTDLLSLTSPAGASQNVFQISEPQEQGTGGSEVIGIRTRPKAIMGRFSYTGRTTAFNNETTTYIRLLVIQWMLDGADQPIVDDILQPVTAQDNRVLAYNNLENVGKFKILYNKIVYLGNQDNSSKFYDVDSFYYEFGKTAKHLMYTELGSGITGQLFLIAFSNKEELSDAPFFTFNIRFRYEDA